MLVLDHILWAVPDLDRGIASLEKLSGVRAVFGGSHPGRGTRNALASLGDDLYLEVISVDPEQQLDNNLGALIRSFQRTLLFTFAVRCNDFDKLSRSAERVGVTVNGPENWSRAQPDGPELKWRLAFLENPEFDRLLPFCIDWLDTPHPALSSPKGMSLVEFEVFHPDAERLNRIYAELEIKVPVRRSDRPGMRVGIASPRGEFVLNS